MDKAAPTGPCTGPSGAASPVFSVGKVVLATDHAVDGRQGEWRSGGTERQHADRIGSHRADLGVALAKVGTAVFTGSSAVAAGAAESLADTANDVFLLIAQRRSSRRPDDQHPLGYGREAYFWSLIAALGVFVTAAAFSLREGIDDLIHPGATSSFAVAYIVPGISAVLDLVSFRQSGGQMSLRARRYHRDLLEESRVTSDPRCGLCSPRTRCPSRQTCSR
jgi:hypothetical protein